jgi:mono/diheme cytochrome c family protein
MVEHNKRPNYDDKDKDIKAIGNWISNQQTNYKKKEYIMSDPDIYDAWTHFTTVKWPDHFISNEDIWRAKLAEVDAYITANGKRPSKHYTNKDIKALGYWIGDQQQNYKKRNEIMSDPDIYDAWTHFTTVKWQEHFMTNEDIWRAKLAEVDAYITANGKRPSDGDKNKDIKTLGKWISNQVKNYNKNEAIMSDPSIRSEWENFTTVKWPHLFTTQQVEPSPITKPKKSMELKVVANPSPKPLETPAMRKLRVKSELSTLHQKYKTMKSSNLAEMFQTDPTLWHTYHETSESNEQSFDQSSIPRNRIISELEVIKTSRRTKKLIVDMGCGKAHIARHFTNDPRFEFLNYDHISSSSTVIQGDISHLPLEDNTVDYCILSLAMWGSNCQEYIAEAYRILESNGRLFIIEPTKRWSETTPAGQVIDGTQGNRLRELITSCGFRIDEQHIDKFCMFKCSRVD